MSRVCETFGCVPTVALQELDRNPELVIDIMQMRAYAATRDAWHRATSEADAPKGPMADLVTDIEVELLRERQARGDDDDDEA